MLAGTQRLISPPAAIRGLPRPGPVVLLLIALITWLPLQTPVAIWIYQYARLPVEAVRGVVLAKDVVVAAAVVVLAARALPAVKLRWFDGCAIVYLAALAVYAIVPYLGPTHPSVGTTIAGLREFGLPVECYALGRLAAASRLPIGGPLRVLLVVAMVSAVATVYLFMFVPVSFWTTTLDLVRYVHDVQGLPYAHSLWDISVVGTYGRPDSPPIARAIGPFTHPVGTAAYFVLPFALAMTGAFVRLRGGVRPRGIWVGVGSLCLASVIFSISRGSWMAALLAIAGAGMIFRRRVVAATLIVAIVVFVSLVPPFSQSVASAINGSDGSTVAHQEAIDKGVNVVADNPLGVGVANSDVVFGQVLGGPGGESTILENTFLAVFVAAGPVGLLAFTAWLVGLVAALWPGRRRTRFHWPGIAVALALVGLLGASLTSATLLRFTTGATLWILVGLLVGRSTARSAFPGRRGAAALRRLLPEPRRVT